MKKEWQDIYNISYKFSLFIDFSLNLSPSELAAIYFYSIKNNIQLISIPSASILNLNYINLIEDLNKSINKISILTSTSSSNILKINNLFENEWKEYYNIIKIIEEYEGYLWLQSTSQIFYNKELNENSLIDDKIDDNFSNYSSFFRFNLFFNNKIAKIISKRCLMESNIAKISSLGGAYFLSKKYNHALYYAKLHTYLSYDNDQYDQYIKGLIFQSINYYLLNKKKLSYQIKNYILKYVKKNNFLYNKLYNTLISYIKWFKDQKIINNINNDNNENIFTMF